MGGAAVFFCFFLGLTRGCALPLRANPEREFGGGNIQVDKLIYMTQLVAAASWSNIPQHTRP